MLLPLKKDTNVGAIRTEWQRDGSIKMWKREGNRESFVVHFSAEEARKFGLELISCPEDPLQAELTKRWVAMTPAQREHQQLSDYVAH